MNLNDILSLDAKVIAISKYATIEQIEVAKQSGFTIFGESKAQELEKNICI